MLVLGGLSLCFECAFGKENYSTRQAIFWGEASGTNRKPDRGSRFGSRDHYPQDRWSENR